MNYTKLVMISRLRRFGIATSFALVATLGISIFAQVPAALAAPGERVVVTTKPVSSITNQADLANVGDDVITIKNGATTLGTQKVKPSIIDGKLGYTATFDPIAPGNPLTACSEKAAACVDFEKKANEDRTVQIQGKNPSIDKPGAEEEKTCSTGTGLAGALSYVLCPLTSLMISATGFIERNLIIPYLTVSPLQTGDNPVYKLWESMRNIANIAFIIAFFMVIFSQATSVGLSNYGIKRLLPRLAIVAIGTNLSYFIVAFAIDAFNVFGAGISQLVMQAIAGGGGTGGTDPSAGNIFAISAVAGVGITIAAVVTSAGSVIGWLFSLLGVAFLILVVAVIVLILRQMVILLLVIVSPFAFVAWLLPNTEKYFTKWRGLLIQLLMMYPIIVLLFATGKIVQRLIVGYDFDLASGEGAAEGSAEAIKVIMGFFAAAVPLVALPAVFTASGSLMGKLYNRGRTMGQNAASKTKEKAGERLKPWMDEKKLQMARSNSRVLRGLGGARIMRREAKRKSRMAEYERAKAEFLANETINNPRFARQSAGIGGAEGVGRVVANAENLIAKLDAEEMKSAIDQLRRTIMSEGGANINGQWVNNTDRALMHVAMGGAVTTRDGKTINGDTALYREAATQKLANDGRSDQIRTIQDHYENMAAQGQATGNAAQVAAGNNGTAMTTRAINDNFSSLIGKAPDLVKGPGTAFGDATGETVSSFNQGTIAAMSRYMSEQQAASQDASLTPQQRTAANDNYQRAMNALDASLQSIASTPQLRAKFSGDSGLRLLQVAAGNEQGVSAAVAQHIANTLTNVNIDPNSGKLS